MICPLNTVNQGLLAGCLENCFKQAPLAGQQPCLFVLYKIKTHPSGSLLNLLVLSVTAHIKLVRAA